MRRLLAYMVSGTLLLSACGGGEEQNGGTSSKEARVAKGEAAYGGTFSFSENEKIASLFPFEITDLSTAHVAWQIYEGLLRIDQKDLSLQPSLAEKWEVSEDKLEYTFHLKKGVLFHDDPCFSDGKGREVKASDVKYSLELASTKGIADNNFESFLKDRLEGAEAFYKGEAKEISGIQVVDDYTIKLKSLTPSKSFAYLLANPVCAVIPKEAYDKYGKKLSVGTGAFRYVSSANESSDILLVRNENYHRVDKWGNQLPYLDTVRVQIIEEDADELERFRSGQLSMIYGLPSEKITEVVQENIPDFINKPPKYILLREPEMSTQFYELNMRSPHLKNIKVRRALAYAVNRKKIMENVLNGQAAANGPRQDQTGNYGITPPIYQFAKYDTSKIKGYTFNPEMAKKLMAEAGFAGGKGFPTLKLEVNYGGSKNTKVATEIVNQWREVLGINVELEQASLAQKIDDSKYGRADIFRSAWVADYPSPESFLGVAYGKNVPESMEEPSHPNTMRYQSADFDKHFEMGMAAATEEEQLAHFAEAERILMEDCPIIIIWYAENYRLLHSDVNNFNNNPMNFFDLSDIYLKAPVAPEKKKEATQ